MKKRNYKIWIILIAGFVITVCHSCKKFVEVPTPETELAKSSVFNDEATAKAAIISIYVQLSGGLSFANGNLSIEMAAYSDDLFSYASPTSASAIPAFFYNNVVPANSEVSSIWGSCYSLIYQSNLAIEGLKASTKVSAMAKNQLLGEAYFMRAFAHFYLLNLFGDIPLVLSSDYRVNTKIGRTVSADIYKSIIADLIIARSLLTDSYPTPDRVRVNRGAAIAFLARAYLYAGDYVSAEATATEIINTTAQYQLQSDLNKVFLKTSSEAIWQLLPNGGLDTYTNEASVFIVTSIPPTNVVLRDEMMSSFESGDQRKVNWTKSITSSSGLTTWYYPFKYKENFQNQTGSEYSMVFRLAEQYLIRAEARAQQNKLIGANSAASDIDIIRNRAGLGGTAATTKGQLMDALLHERQAELFTEWGHRFFDLKRYGKIDAALISLKPNWKSYRALLPLPQSEILTNVNLKQNPGY